MQRSNLGVLVFLVMVMVLKLDFFMTLIRTIIFNILFFIWMFNIEIIFHLFFFNRNILIKISRIMAGVNAWLLKYIVGISLDVSGKENIINSGCVIASKHQSAMETLAMFHQVNGLAYVFKKELGYIPLFGTSNYLVGNVAVNRGGGGAALKSLIKNVKKAVSDGRKVMIFPEGTRTKVGESVPYKPAIYALYKQGLPVVPCALNTGCFWPRKSMMKHAGAARVKFLPQVPEGLSKDEFMSYLSGEIERESSDLIPSGYSL